jgi:hypothetical protein
MSHRTASIAGIARATRETARTSGILPEAHVMSTFSPPNPNRIPVSLRPSHELWARAAELNRMATTARTVDTRIALETLAARFAALAAAREAAEGPQPDHEIVREATEWGGSSGG